MPEYREFVVDIGLGQPIHVLFFDGFAIKRLGGFVDLDFLSNRSNRSLTVRVSEETLENSKESFTKYLASTGQPETPQPKPIRCTPETVVFADFIGLARHGEVAEVSFHAISWKVALDGGRVTKSKAKDTAEPRVVPAICIALLRTAIETQRHWVGSLYE
jgi:hypothetical protein